MDKERKGSAVNPLFAAANSGRGFVSFYGDIFGTSLERRYIIKGGPGTGKSSFMKRVAAAAEERGASVDYYRCSSDFESLDGIIIDGKTAVIDGTAPHSVDTEQPGARDEIVNLGEFWDSKRLALMRAEIETIGEKKGERYRTAYRFLEACDSLFAINRSLILPVVKHEKMQRAAARIAEEIERGEGYSLRAGLINSVGMKGQARLDSYERAAKRLYCVRDHYRTGALFLRALLLKLYERDCPILVSYDSIHISEPDAVYLEHTGDCFVIADEKTSVDYDSEINMKRFTDGEALRSVRGEYRCNSHIYDAMLSSACDALKGAGEAHFALERIYSEAMDFAALGEFTDRFIAKMFG